MSEKDTGNSDFPRKPMPAEPVTVDRPRHHLPQMTTSELATYRRELEHAVAFFEQTQAPALTLMRDRLAGVLAEQADRARPAAGA